MFMKNPADIYFRGRFLFKIVCEKRPARLAVFPLKAVVVFTSPNPKCFSKIQAPYPRPYSKRGDSNVFDEMPGLGGVITQASGINTASIWCESPDSGRLNKYCESIVGAH